MMTLYFPFLVVTEVASYATAVHTADSIKLLKKGYCIVVLDGIHRYRSIKRPRDEDGVTWAPEPFCMRYEFHVDGKAILTAQAIKLNKIGNICTANKQRKVFTETMQSLLSCAQASEEGYVLRFVYVRISKIVDDRMSSTFLAAISGATYIRHIRVNKMMNKRHGVLPIPQEVRKEQPSGEYFWHQAPS